MKIEISPLKQETDYTCLPTCIRTIINYFGTNVPENEIAGACHTTKAGTRLRDAAIAIKSYGFEITQIQDGTMDELFQSIHDQEPVIVILGVEHLPYGDFGTHAVVVNGFEGADIIYADPALGKEMRMNMLSFLNAWQSRGKKGIIIHRR